MTIVFFENIFLYFCTIIMQFETIRMFFTGITIAISTFLIIGLFHPIVIKTEYYYGTRPWWIFLILGIACLVASLCIEQITVSSLLGVIGASFIWSIKELFEQKKRVDKGWFPKKEK